MGLSPRPDQGERGRYVALHPNRGRHEGWRWPLGSTFLHHLWARNRAERFPSRPLPLLEARAPRGQQVHSHLSDPHLPRVSCIFPLKTPFLQVKVLIFLWHAPLLALSPSILGLSEAGGQGKQHGGQAHGLRAPQAGLASSREGPLGPELLCGSQTRKPRGTWATRPLGLGGVQERGPPRAGPCRPCASLQPVALALCLAATDSRPQTGVKPPQASEVSRWVGWEWGSQEVSERTERARAGARPRPTAGPEVS